MADISIALVGKDEASAAIKSVNGALGDLNTSSGAAGATMDKVAGSADTFGKALGGIGLIAGGALAAGLAASITSAAGFEAKLSSIGAVSGATASEMAGISDLALKLGADTAFSASEAAQGIEELVKGGLTIADVMGGGAKAALDLAAAGELSVADAAEIASNAVGQFSLKGGDLGHVADLIAGAANASSLSVTDFKFSLSAVGAVAATVGLSFDDTAIAIAEMGKAGIKGSDAGTSLKTMLLNLQPTTKAQVAEFQNLGLATTDYEAVLQKLLVVAPTFAGGQAAINKLQQSGTLNAMSLYEAMQKLNPAYKGVDFNKFAADSNMVTNAFFDQEGHVKSLADIQGLLGDAMKDLTDQQKMASLEVMFGSDAIRAGAVLAKAGAEGYTEMAESMGKVTAADVAAGRLNNLNGSIQAFMGSLETAAITIGLKFTPVLKAGVDTAIVAVNGLVPALSGVADLAMSALLPLATFIGNNFQAIMAGLAVVVAGVVIPAFVAWAAAAAAAAVATLVALAPLVLLGAAVAVVVAAWTNDWGQIRTIVTGVVTFLSGLPDTIGGFFNQLSSDLTSTLNGLSSGISSTFNQIAASIGTALDLIGSLISVAWTGYIELSLLPLRLLQAGVMAIWDALPADIRADLELIGTTLIERFAAFVTSTQTWLTDTGTAISQGWTTITTTISTALNGVTTLIGTSLSGMLTAIGTWTTNTITAFSTWGTNVGTQAVTAANNLTTPITTGLENVLTGIGTWVGEVLGKISGLATSIVSEATKVGQGILDGITGALNAGRDALGNLMGDIARQLISVTKVGLGIASPSTEFAIIGQDILGGLQDGMSGALGGLQRWVTDNLANALPQWVRDVLGIKSPSSVFADIGANIIAGLQNGILGAWPSVETVIKRLMDTFAGLSANVSGDAADWLKAALAITQTPMDWFNDLYDLMQMESSGDPRAQNPNDVIDARGHNYGPAKGLMQMLEDTFNAHKLEGFGDIWNPIDNTVSAIRYIKDEYGSVHNINRSPDGGYEGYAEGGIVPGPPGLGQWAYVHGGERIQTPAQQHGSSIDYDRLERILARSGAGRTINVYPAQAQLTEEGLERTLYREELRSRW